MAKKLHSLTRSIQLSAFFDRYGVTLITLALLSLLIWLIVQWTWLFLQPSPKNVLPQALTRIDINAAAEQIASTHLFGIAGQTPAVTQETQASTLNLRLKGVFAFNPPISAFAILDTGSKSKSYKTGDEIMPGIFLSEVHSRHIVIDHNGLKEKIMLDERPGSGGTGVSTVPRPNIQPSMVLPTNPTGAPRIPGNFPRPDMSGNMQDRPRPSNVGKMNVTPPGGGITIQEIPSNSTAEKIGLQSGDVVRSINGNAVSSPFDLARLYQQAAPGAPINVEGTRGSRPFNLTNNERQ